MSDTAAVASSALPAKSAVEDLLPGLASSDPARVAAAAAALVDFTGGAGNFSSRQTVCLAAGAEMEASCAEAVAALPALCSALTAHLQDAAAVEPICRALRNISAVEPHKVTRTEAVFPAVVAALQAHAGVEALVIVACAFLFNSTISSKAGCKMIVAAGAVPAVAALTTHASQAVLLEACSALTRLGQFGQDAGALLSAAQAIVTMLKAHVTEGVLVTECCKALRCFSCSSEGMAACVAAGAVPALVRALQAADSRVAEEAVMALLAISAAPGQAVYEAAVGDFPALIAAWRRATAP